jgi:hypothetical protein
METKVNVRKASRKAAQRSLDGHVRFVVALGRSLQVFDLFALATCDRRVDVVAAFASGRHVAPRTH